ncbi:hypothetical protein QVD17_38943 [Tagetes erecta]|uniref:FH2 domain-containing protein n=1 Tax=Tagetes erecta TaxID=13708 RepID=A0AAD8NER3_TARER|nr:hypothetical protein QVD17_38943 [Tagetes erecta]
MNTAHGPPDCPPPPPPRRKTEPPPPPRAPGGPPPPEPPGPPPPPGTPGRLGGGPGRGRGGPAVKKSSIKPLQWNRVTRSMQGTLWDELQRQSGLEVDVSELEALFSNAPARRAAP